jgi:DNA polymerase III epsilon subunit-like protein
MKYNKEEILEIYNTEISKTEAARIYAAQKGIEYNDTVRRKVAEIIQFGDNKLEKSEIEIKSSAKILLFDLETSPIIARVWSLWQNGINIDDIVRDWSLLCFSAKWLFANEVISFRLTEEELQSRDDSRIVRELWNLLDRADIVIAHNAERFDVRKSNARFLKYELNLPSPYQVIDTLKHAKKRFNFTSNKLDYIARYLGVEGKMITPSGMWRQVEEGNYDMLIEMDKYCQQDVICLEQVYLKLRAYIQPHPNIGLHIVDNVHSCPSCGNQDLNWEKDNVYTTNANQYHAFRCNSCKSLGRSRTPVLKAKDRSKLTIPNAR